MTSWYEISNPICTYRNKALKIETIIPVSKTSNHKQSQVDNSEQVSDWGTFNKFHRSYRLPCAEPFNY